MTSHELSDVWIFQPRVEHYRLPVFDAVAKRGAAAYRLKVFGPTNGGEAFGGGERGYIHEFPYRRRKIAGLRIGQWPGMHAAIRSRQPNVVIANTHLRNVDCWQLPSTCADVGAAIVGWGKVHSFSDLPRWLIRPAKARMFNRFDFFIAYGQTSRQELLDVGMPERKIVVAQNTIDTGRIFEKGDAYRERGAQLRRERGLEDAVVILSVARFDAVKRLHDLLDAWPKLRAVHPRLHLVLVGGGLLLDDVRARAAALDPERIHLTGRVPEGDDYAWIAAADVTVQCGAVGLAMNQSMAFGVPTVIADEFGADTEILEDRRTGWRYERGNVEALVETIAEIRATPERTAAITEAARRLLRDNVTIEAMADSIHACIEQACARARTRRQELKGAVQ